MEMTRTKPRKHWLRKVILTLVGMFVLAALGIAGWVLVNSRDIPAPDLSDVMLQRQQVPAEQNAYTHLERAAEALVWPEDDKFLQANSTTQAEDDARIREALVANGEALRHLKAGLACEVCVALQDWSPEATWPARKLGRLSKLLGAEAGCQLRAGNHKAAVTACADGLRFGNLMAQDASCCLMWIVGVCIVSDSAAWARKIANDPEIADADLVALLGSLNSPAPLERGLKRAFKGEFMMVDNIITRVENGTMEMPLQENKAEKIQRRALPPSYLFQPNRSRYAAAEMTRAAILAIPQCVAEPLPEVGTSELTSDESKFELFSKRNPIGRILLEMIAISSGNIIHAKSRAVGHLDGARLVVALRLFEKRTGKLPAELDELVPAYLSAVPQDPFDGKPFRYLPQKRLVYAVGMDLKDSGGTKAPLRKAGERFQPNPDEVFELDAGGVE